MRKCAGLVLLAGSLAAQVAVSTQGSPTPADIGQTPVYRVDVVTRTAKAINYHHRQGSTRIAFRGTSLMPEADGQARVESRTGSTKIEAQFDKLGAPTRYGYEYLTLVLWAITPEGRAQNLGEVVRDGEKARLLATTELQAFGLIVTAEPYFAVSQPGDLVVMENVVERRTTGTVEDIEAKYELLPKGSYTAGVPPQDIQTLAMNTDNAPLDLLEARNAFRIAQANGADRYAPETMARARVELQNAEAYRGQGGGSKKALQTVARQATQFAEDARLISLRKQEEERLAAERAAAAEREARARAQAEREARERAQAEAAARAEVERRQFAEAEQARLAAEKASAERARLEAERIRQEAELAAAQAARERQAAEAAQQEALQQQQQLQAQAQEAERLRREAEAEKAELRAQLLRQLNLVLETRDTARGLIVNISDVLFDFNKYSLRPAAREKLARVAGIVASHPGLKLAVEGHTDSVGSEDYNQRLSEQRAGSVRNYLVAQGISPESVSASGLGKSMPVASNATAAGRQRNRRVELVVSGELIGNPVAPSSESSAVTAPR